MLSATLTHLTFSPFFDQPLTEEMLPQTLNHLDFGSEFNHPIEEILPETLTHLTFLFSSPRLPDFSRGADQFLWTSTLKNKPKGRFVRGIFSQDEAIWFHSGLGRLLYIAFRRHLMIIRIFASTLGGVAQAHIMIQNVPVKSLNETKKKNRIQVYWVHSSGF